MAACQWQPTEQQHPVFFAHFKWCGKEQKCKTKEEAQPNLSPVLLAVGLVVADLFCGEKLPSWFSFVMELKWWCCTPCVTLQFQLEPKGSYQGGTLMMLLFVSLLPSNCCWKCANDSCWLEIPSDL